MGGWNSGRNDRGAGRCESWHRVELAYLRDQDLLRPGRCSTLSWHRGGEQTGSIGFHAFERHAELRYSCDGETVVQRIRYRYTPTNFGGQRMWLECPNCYRACSVLYGGRRFYCRKCWRLTYASQYEVWWERARSQAEKIRTKLGQPGFIDIDSTHDFPDKPKRMRWHTYRRLRAKDTQLMRAYEDGFCSIAMAFLRRHG
jgi:hypothetical protein